MNQIGTEQIELVVQSDESTHQFVLHLAIHQFILLSFCFHRISTWLSGKQFYEFVWADSMRILAPRFGISDVALMGGAVTSCKLRSEKLRRIWIDSDKHLVSIRLQMRGFSATEELVTLTKQTKADQCERGQNELASSRPTALAGPGCISNGQARKVPLNFPKLGL